VKKKLLPIGLATLSGVLYALGFVGYDQFYLEWIAFAPLVVALGLTTTGRRAFFLSWWMGTCAQMVVYVWIVHLLRTFASLSVPLAVLGYLLLCIGQGFQMGLAGWLAFKLTERTRIPIGWTYVVGLVATEFIVPMLFPSYTANSQAWVPLLIQVVELGGTLLLSGIIALVGGALGEVILARITRRPFPRGIALWAAGAFAFVIVWGLVRMPMVDARDAAAPKLKVAIVQANIGAGEKHLHAEAGIARFREQTDAVLRGEPGLGLVVWPESALNRSVSMSANLSGVVASDVKVPMIVGAVRRDAASGRIKHWNSLLDVAPGGQVVAAYDKVKLLVFGETLPLYETIPGFYEWLLKQGLLPYVSVFSQGTTTEPLPVGPYRLSADVCYEDIIPRHIRDLMVPIDEHGTRPHAMVNGTNDSWYGPAEPPIHLALAVFRAVEHRRWLIRATATGISAFVDSSGRLVQKSGFETAETLVQDVPMIEGGATVYGLVGDVLGWLSLAAAAYGLLQKRLRPARGPKGIQADEKAATGVG